MEDPDDHEDYDNDNSDDVEALLADPFVDVLELSVVVVDTLVHAVFFTAAVEKRPDEVDTGGHNDKGVDGNGVGVEAYSSESFAQGAPETNDSRLSVNTPIY